MGIGRVCKTSAVIAAGCLFAVQAQSALVATGSAVFSEPSGGVTAPFFSGTLYAEVFDAGGGTFSRTGDLVGATGGFTTVLQLVTDLDTGDPVKITDASMAAFMLGPGSFGNDPTGGGSYGGDPTFSTTGLPGFVNALYTFGGGGMAEGASSNAFYFTHPSLDLSGDSMFFNVVAAPPAGGSTSVNSSIVLAAVPVPAAVWLFGSGLIGLTGLARRGRR